MRVVYAPPEALSDQTGIHGLRVVLTIYAAADAILGAVKGDGPVAAGKLPDRPLLPSGRLAP